MYKDAILNECVLNCVYFVHMYTVPVGHLKPAHCVDLLCFKSNLKEALLSHSVEYRRTYLAALVAVMAAIDSTSVHHLPQTAPPEEPVPPECIDLLLGNLEGQKGGPEFLAQSLCVASLLLSQWSDYRFLYVSLFLVIILMKHPDLQL